MSKSTVIGGGLKIFFLICSMMIFNIIVTAAHAISISNSSEEQFHKYLQIINKINQQPSSKSSLAAPLLWRAAPNDMMRNPERLKFGLKSIKELEEFAMSDLAHGLSPFMKQHLILLRSLLKKASMMDVEGQVSLGKPMKNYMNVDQFDSRERWPHCIHPIRDQGNCGSCYSFASSEVMSDRFCIASNGSVNVVLSPQDLVTCSWYSFGCNGGIPGLVFDYIHKDGLVSDNCFPYLSYNGDTSYKCPAFCYHNKTQPFHSDKHFADKVYHVGEFLENKQTRVLEIQKEILTNGPVNADFIVYSDFPVYKSGVYRHQTGSFEGIHAVKIIGWGYENGVDYWLVANSWGNTFGIDGFFKIVRGVDECGIEMSVYAGTPKL